MLSLILPIRDWPLERLDASLRSFARLPADLLGEIIVVDFGSAEPIALEGHDARARVIRLEAKVWSLSEAINAGVLAATGDILAKTDADVLLDPGATAGLRQAVNDLATGRVDLLLGQLIDLPPDYDVPKAAEHVAAGRISAGRIRAKWGQGGLALFTRAAWTRIGGFDSRYTAWGGEDNDFAERARRSGSRIGWLDRKGVRIFHVWHPPNYHRPDEAKQRRANLDLLNNDRSIFRTLRFRHSDPTPVMAPNVIRQRHPLVTIALATSARPGRDRMIREAIDSFRGQIDNDFETLVIDNGSDDESHEALKTALAGIRWDAGIRLERQREGSIPGARNEIARLARGLYICVDDDDDVALPNRLAEHLRPFNDNGLIHGTHGGWIDYDETTGQIERNTGKRRTIETLLKGRGKITAHPASFYRTDVMRAVPYDEAFSLGSDWDLALRMAALGLTIAHTGSYVTLRRFHAANVTFTGTSRQVSNGLRSRVRTMALHGPRMRDHIARSAPAQDSELECYNDLSVEEIVGLLPPYVGVWRLLLPFEALQDDLLDPRHPDDPTRLEQLLDLVDGDVAALRSGLDQQLMFRSAPIKGARRVRKLAGAIRETLGMRPTILADEQVRTDRGIAFDWTTLQAPAGAALLVSERFRHVEAALAAKAKLPPQSLLQTMVGIVSDYDSEGEAHYLATTAIKARETARDVQAELQAYTGASFSFARTPSAGQPTEPGDRQH